MQKNDYQIDITRIGTLYDREIAYLASKGELIVEEFEEKSIRQACYELRAGNVYYDLAQESKRISVNNGSYILIKPRQLIVIITKETVKIPNDMLARILTKGKLFSIGLLPVNTYADPGFYGKLGIVFFNASINYLKILPDEPIAKIEFTRLEHPVNTPYHGQHGYHTQIWPIPTEMIMSSEEIERDDRIGPKDQELRLSYGSEIASVVEKIARYYRLLMFLSLGYFTFFLALIVLITKEIAISVGIGVGVGIVANILTQFVLSGATDFSRRKRWKFGL